MAEEYDELVKKLEKLKSLYEQNLITEEEYNNRKNSLLDADFSNNSNSNNNSNGVVSEINQKEIAAESYFDSKKDKKPVSKIIIWLLILGLLAGVAVFLFGKGSSSLSFLKKDSPEKSVSSILDAVIDADFISLSKQLNFPQEEVSKLLSEEIGIENLSAQSLLNVQKTLKKLTGNIKYDLDTQSETDNTSTVKAYITMPDYVTGNMDELKEMAGEFILAAVLGSKEDEYVDIVCSCIDSITASKPTNDVEITVDLAVEKINGKWTVVDILDIDGGVLGMLVDLGDLFGNTTASSQSSKLDNILSGFNSQNSSQNSTSNKNVLYTGTSLAEMHVRKGPGTSYEVTRNIAYGTTVSVYEEKQAEGYLWCRISENEWIADDGTWLKKNGGIPSGEDKSQGSESKEINYNTNPCGKDVLYYVKAISDIEVNNSLLTTISFPAGSVFSVYGVSDGQAQYKCGALMTNNNYVIDYPEKVERFEYDEFKNDQYIKSVTASSMLTDSYMEYKPSYVTDGLQYTSWVEGATGYGLNEYLTLSFSKSLSLCGISICNGYGQNFDLYKQNSRVKQIKVEFSDGAYEYCDVYDAIGKQYVMFKSSHNTNSIKLIITDVYPGSVYSDTSITEVHLVI